MVTTARRKFGSDPSCPGLLFSLLENGDGYASLLRFREERGGGKIVVLNHRGKTITEAAVGLAERAMLCCFHHADCREATRRLGVCWLPAFDGPVDWERVARSRTPVLGATPAVGCFEENGRLRGILDEDARREVDLSTRYGVLCDTRVDAALQRVKVRRRRRR